MNNTLKTLAIIFIGVSCGVTLLMYTLCKVGEAYRIKQLYLVERARADAAAKLIEQVGIDWDGFNDETAESNAYCEWRLATEVAEKTTTDGLTF